jgi:hypothetical protein
VRAWRFAPLPALPCLVLLAPLLVFAIGDEMLNQISLTLHQVFVLLGDWLYNWQTLISAIFASLVAAGS